MRNEKPVVLYDSDEAAQPHTMQGWKSRKGFFYTSEDVARYDGCTHRKCERCDNLVEKMWSACADCRKKATRVRYIAMPTAKWDGEQMLYSEEYDRYFSSLDEAEDFLVDEDGYQATLAAMMLVLCEPRNGPWLDWDFFSDCLAEDYELPSELQDAVADFNTKVQAYGTLSWVPGDYRLEESA